ncbi:MAG: hypothetical protein GQ569_14830 [Methylococcaceae bacterium]|nr:hypothetical protein [Methylococcaceae bacterium]
MKTITIEVEDNYWLEILDSIKKFPIKIIEEKNNEPSQKIKTPLEEIGFIGCGAADENLSVNYKEKLTQHLKEKHDL